jgi:ribosome-binding ATPase YchF (GTP1/OBG family)
VVIISAKIEAELSELDKDEAKEYLKDLGVESSGIERMIRSVYDLLGLRTYITAGEKEVRAWTIEAGTKAPQAGALSILTWKKDSSGQKSQATMIL